MKSVFVVANRRFFAVVPNLTWAQQIPQIRRSFVPASVAPGHIFLR